jgi:glutathione synthase/RimK-type ligase-like ATP-grasp enzyme
MKIAIHHKINSFSNYWISYCKLHKIDYKIVNCYDSNIFQQLEDCDALMWHFSHVNYKDMLFAKQLLFSVSLAGKKVFPDFQTMWHFDDKVGQKYLFEFLEVPMVTSYVFYSKAEAMLWVSHTTFPKVFKLRGGAGSANVKLVLSNLEAKKIIRKAFGRGFLQFDRMENLHERVRKFKEGRDSIIGVAKGIARLIIPIEFSKMRSREKGYVYFQDYIPNNSFDIRVIVINQKAFAIKRLVRKNDFRASGSGHILYDKKEFDERCVQIAFDATEKIQSQCAGYDFVFDENKNPLIVEVSYGFNPHGYDSCTGYWDREMQWHEGLINPYGWMVETIIDK